MHRLAPQQGPSNTRPAAKSTHQLRACLCLPAQVPVRAAHQNAQTEANGGLMRVAPIAVWCATHALPAATVAAHARADCRLSHSSQVREGRARPHMCAHSLICSRQVRSGALGCLCMRPPQRRPSTPKMLHHHTATLPTCHPATPQHTTSLARRNASCLHRLSSHNTAPPHFPIPERRHGATQMHTATPLTPSH